VEPELADALVDDVEGEPGALPLLSTALLELWQKRQDKTLSLAAYRESGGVQGAVARLAEGTYARIPDERKPLVRAMMLRLVGEDEGDAPVRRRVPLAELDQERNKDVAEVLETLADSRLVTVGEGSVEVAHEALLREWPRLREWIEEDAEGRRLRRHITQAAAEWDAAARDQGELYRGARLAAALDWTADHALDLNEREREFVIESREVAERETKRTRRTNRRLRALLAGVAVLLVAAVAGGIFAVIQRGEARDAETARLAQRLSARALVEDDLDLSLLLARQAVAIDDSPQSRLYLFQNLVRVPSAIGIVRGSPDFLRAIAVSRDGKTLAVGSYRNGLVFFDARTYNPKAGSPSTPDDVESLAYSPGGETLAVGGDGYIRLLDANTHERLAEALVDGVVQQMSFTSDGSRLVVGLGEFVRDSISVRSARTLTPIGPQLEPDGFVGTYRAQFWAQPGFVVTPDGSTLITASRRNELLWWDLRSGERTRSPVRIGTGYHALALSADGTTLAVGIDRGIQLVDTRGGEVRTAAGVLRDPPNSLHFSADGRTVVSTGRDGAVTLWDVGSASLREALTGHSASVAQAVFTPDGRTLLTASHDGTAIAWDIAGDRGLRRPFSFTHARASRDFSGRHPGMFSPDSRLIVVGLKQRGLQLRDAKTLAPVGAPLLATGGEVNALASSGDGRTFAAGTSNGKVTLWDVASRSLRLGPFAVSSEPVASMSFSADGTMLATTGEDAAFAKLWNAATGAALGTVGDGSNVGTVAFSPTGRFVALIRSGYPLSSDPEQQAGDVEFWDPTRRSLIKTLRVEAKPKGIIGQALAFSSDGRLIASGGIGYNVVQVWDVETGELIRELEENVGGALVLEFSPGNSILAVSGYGEPFASLLDVATGEQIGPRLNAGGESTMIDVSADGRRLLETHGTGEGAIWDIDPESWKRRACALANRTLTREEWEEFLPGRSYEPACRD
jgi:WD40 repeat protein